MSSSLPSQKDRNKYLQMFCLPKKKVNIAITRVLLLFCIVILLLGATFNPLFSVQFQSSCSLSSSWLRIPSCALPKINRMNLVYLCRTGDLLLLLSPWCCCCCCYSCTASHPVPFWSVPGAPDSRSCSKSIAISEFLLTHKQNPAAIHPQTRTRRREWMTCGAVE